MAWLHATPRPPAGSERAKTFDLAMAKSRLEKMKADRIPVRMPPNPMPHVIDRLTEIGLTGTNGMGPTALSWGEIAAWQTNTRVALSPWESRLIRTLSATYVAGTRASEDETCPPPWRGEVTEAEMTAEVALLDSILG